MMVADVWLLANSQGGHEIPNEWHGIGTAGHIAVFVFAAIIVVLIIMAWLSR